MLQSVHEQGYFEALNRFDDHLRTAWGDIDAMRHTELGLIMLRELINEADDALHLAKASLVAMEAHNARQGGVVIRETADYRSEGA